MYFGRIVLGLLIIIAFLLPGCSQEEATKPPAIELSNDHACAVCGMVLVEHPGPKAQIHYKDEDTETFCCTPHMLMSYLHPERPRNIRVIYVHDMGQTDWDHPMNYWIEAEKAFYVYGGDKMGAMGETLVPFSTSKAAENYIKDHGGRIIRFEDITMDMLRPMKPDHSSQSMRK